MTEMRGEWPLPLLLMLTVLAWPGCRAAPGLDSDPDGSTVTPPASFTVVDVPPFRVLGDEPPEQVTRRAEGSIRVVANLLRRDLFASGPPPTLDVWLFQDTASIERHCKAIFGHAADPPEGYYSTVEHAVVVDLSRASPEHFLVHTFVHADFPACPVWVDEGLAALFEAWAEEAGHIVGRPDDQLQPLQDDIRAGRLPTLQVLTALDPAGFHGQGWEVHRRMARYLCYFLQQDGKLRPFYEALRANHPSDPGGYEILRGALGVDDMVAFQGSWEAWILALSNED